MFRADLDTDHPSDVVQSSLLWQPALANLNDFTTLEAQGGIGTASWVAGAGILRQDGNYRVVDPPFATPARQGTYAIRRTAPSDGDRQPAPEAVAQGFSRRGGQRTVFVALRLTYRRDNTGVDASSTVLSQRATRMTRRP